MRQVSHKFAETEYDPVIIGGTISTQKLMPFGTPQDVKACNEANLNYYSIFIPLVWNGRSAFCPG